MDKSIEDLFVRAFIEKRRRKRALYELSDSNRRDHYITRICRDFDYRYVYEVEQPINSFLDIYQLLREKGAPDQCYLMSCHDDHDGEILGLKKALETHIFHGYFILSCIHGKLAFAESEIYTSGPHRYVFEKQ